MKARDLVAQLLTPTIVPMSRAAGFRKTGFSFQRRREDALQVITVQHSTGNTGSRGCFFINVGYYWPEVALLEHRPVPAHPHEYQCHFRSRLERLLSETPAQWEFATLDEARLLRPLLEQRWHDLLQLLEATTTIAAFIKRGWLTTGAELGLLAQLEYLQGNTHAAVDALKQEHRFFQARPQWNADDWVARRGLQQLQPYLRKDHTERPKE